jgi:phosphate:Na+ symporter
MFDIFDVLALAGGLSLFLFGMNVMGEGLERRAGNGLKTLLGRLTESKTKAFLTGIGVTAVVQSSSATTVMVVGFVNSKLMSLRQSIGVIMGANIGTTVTAWVLSLGGISGDSVVLKLLKPMSFTPILAFIGIVFTMFSKSSKRRDVGTVLLGFATLMFGMDAMSDAVSGLAQVPEFQNLFLVFTNPLLGVLVGALVTAIVQSSTASVGILQALSATGAVPYSAAIPIIMGQNIGTCVTAILSSLGAGKNAKRASLIHLSFNGIGTVIWLTVFVIVSAVFKPVILNGSATFLGIAVCHSVFNVLCTAVLLPASSLLEKIAYKLVPDGGVPDRAVELDERLLATPSVAIEQSGRLAAKMAVEATESFRLSLRAIGEYTPELAARVRNIECKTDHYEDIIGTYLTKLSKSQVSDEDSATVTKLLKAIGDLERISDHAVNVVEAVEELREKGIEISAAAKAEIDVLRAALEEILDLTEKAFVNNNAELACDVEPLEEVVDNIKKELRNNHIVRLQRGNCTVETGFVWSDLLTDIERVGDHCSNIAVGVIDAREQTMNAHEVLRSMKADNAQYEEKYKEYLEKYSIKSKSLPN